MSNTPSFTALIHLNAARTYLAAALVEVRWAEDELDDEKLRARHSRAGELGEQLTRDYSFCERLAVICEGDVRAERWQR